MISYKLSKAIQGARIPIPKKYYVPICILIAFISLALMATLFLIGDLFHIWDGLSWMPKPLIFFVGCIPIPLGVFLFSYYFPLIIVSGRKSKINLDLPHAITYMQGLSTILPLYDIFKRVAASEELYNEVSKECALIVRDVEEFGLDLVSAMEHTRDTTPSEKFCELLNDLLMVYQSGGDIRGFFNSKSEIYREVAKNELESSMQFLEIMAEIYVTLFVAGPIAIMIVLVAQSLSGKIMVGNLMPLLYLGLPFGAIILITVLYYIMPQSTLIISRKEVRMTEFSSEIIGVSNPQVVSDFEKKFQNQLSIQKIKEILHHPIRFYSSNYYISVGFGILFSVLVFCFWSTGILPSIFSTDSLLLLICMLIIAFMLPVCFAYEIRHWYATRIEKHLPEFLREIVDMRDIGMTLQSAIRMIAKCKSGLLASELKQVSRDIDYGVSLSNALIRMENRVGLPTVKRSLALIRCASKVTDYIHDILMIVANDIKFYLQMKSKRFNSAFSYVAIVYISFGIFLFTAYVITGPLIASFEKYNMSMNLSGSIQDMFLISVILATFSGIISGQMSANSPLAGFKHSIILLLATIIMFVFVI